MFMITSVMILLTVFLGVYSSMYGDVLEDKKRYKIEDFSYGVQKEFIIASSVHPGYRREFELPGKIEGIPYKIDIQSNVLIVNYTENIIYLPLPNVTGDIKKGNNVITTTNTTLCINC